jgi:hypothetical protein
VTGRRLAVLSAGAALLLLFLLADSPSELARRARFLARSASSELALRRLSGSGAAFDRKFFVFLEALRRSLPRDARGVALYAPHPSTQELYLASYQLAPVPVLLAPARVPPRWLAALYGPPPPGEWRVIAPLPGGTLAAPQ